MENADDRKTGQRTATGNEMSASFLAAKERSDKTGTVGDRNSIKVFQLAPALRKSRRYHGIYLFDMLS